MHTNFLAGCANGLIVVVKHNAHFVHEPDLLLIVAVELGGTGGVYVWEETQDGFGGDGGGLGSLEGSNGGRHVGLVILIESAVLTLVVGVLRWFGKESVEE